MDIKSQSINDVPTITVLDLWYTAHGERRVNFSYADIIGEQIHDDWLMQNMALVAKAVFQTGQMPGKGKFIGQLVQYHGPYGIAVAFKNNTQMLDVGVFLKDDDNGSTDDNTQADGTVEHSHAADGSAVADNP